MKSEIHSKDYKFVVFKDLNNDFTFLTRSTAQSDETIKWEDGNEYPLIKVHISSASHPFYTGEEKVLDIEGRVDKFKKKAEAAKKASEARQAKAKKQAQKAKDNEEPEVQKIGSAPKKDFSKPKNHKPAPKPEEQKAKSEEPIKPETPETQQESKEEVSDPKAEN